MDPLSSCTPLDIHRLPEGPAALDDKEYLQEAAQILEAKKNEVATHTDINQFQQFADGVAEITALMRTLTLGEERIRAPIKQSRAMGLLDEEDRSAMPDVRIQTMQHLFREMLQKQATTALASFRDREFEQAERQFGIIISGLKREVGQERYFYFQANQMVALIRQPNKIADAIHLMLRLENSVPDIFVDWFHAIVSHVKRYVENQFVQNESEIEKCRKEIERQIEIVEGTLSTQQLQHIKDFSPLLASLKSVKETLETLQKTLIELDKNAQTLSELLRLLNVERQSAIETVKQKHKNWLTLVNGAGHLLLSLARVKFHYEKHQILSEWIASHIGFYQHQKLSALHTWAFSLLGKTFIPAYVGQADLDKTVHLFREQWSVLSPHRSALLHDVKVNIGKKSHNESLLSLAAFSETIRSGHAKSTSGNKGSTWESLPDFISKPKVLDLDLHMMISNSLPHIQDLQAVLDLLFSTIFPTAQSSQQNGDEQHLTERVVEQIVALFEIAHYLQMPKEIMNHTLEPLLRPDFDNHLTAIQWLRFAPARGIYLPYHRLEKLFQALTKDQVFEWLRLYKEDPAIIDPKEHHKLFFILVNWAMAYEKNKIPLNAQERGEFFHFLAKLYLFLHTKQVQIGKETQNKIDQSLVKFGAACITAGLDLKQAEVLKYITFYSTEEMKELMTDKIQNWLEQSVFPTIKELVVVDTFDSTKFRSCQAVSHLSLQGKQKGNWSDLKSTFGDLRHLNLDGQNSELDLSGVDLIPLTSLTLRKIANPIDFKRCSGLAKTLEELSFYKAAPMEGTLSDLIHLGKLKSVSFSHFDSSIGSLAPEQASHRRPSLETLVFEQVILDDMLTASLPRLIKSQAKLSSLVLKCHNAEYLVQRLTDLRGKLELAWTSRGRLEHFTQLKELTHLSFFIKNPREQAILPERTAVQEELEEAREQTTIMDQIQQFQFEGCDKLTFIKCIFPNGEFVIRSPEKNND